MALQVIGAGLPRTGTSSLRIALEQLLGGKCLTMSAIEGHPFQLGDGWHRALAGEHIDWTALLHGFVAAVDWPASEFWPELIAANPGALVVLSERDDFEDWHDSMAATILPVARLALAPGWSGGRGLLELFEHFTGTSQWNDPEILRAAYERHLAAVIAGVPAARLLRWHASEGWGPLCRALKVTVPEGPFPWVNRRADWG
jgi:Sulfotransferase domain